MKLNLERFIVANPVTFLIQRYLDMPLLLSSAKLPKKP